MVFDLWIMISNRILLDKYSRDIIPIEDSQYGALEL